MPICKRGIHHHLVLEDVSFKLIPICKRVNVENNPTVEGLKRVGDCLSTTLMRSVLAYVLYLPMGRY